MHSLLKRILVLMGLSVLNVHRLTVRRALRLIPRIPEVLMAISFSIYILIPYLVFSISRYRYRKTYKAKSVDAFLMGIDSNKDYVLILRPFGADGTIVLQKYSNFLSRYFIRSKFNETIEEIISDESTKHDIEVISILDPGSKLIVPGPQYLYASDNWKSEVERLICRALCVVFVFPPSKQLTSSIMWELNCVARKGLSDRFQVFFPLGDDNSMRFHEEIASLNDIFPQFDQDEIFSKEVYSITYSGDDSEYHYVDIPEFDKKNHYSDIFRECARGFLSRVKSKTSMMTKGQKYPYLHLVNLAAQPK